jgi:predicted ester cyclase
VNGNVALADGLFGENVRTNAVLVGVAGPKRRIQEWLAGFSDLTTTIEHMFSAHDKIVTRLIWRGTHTGSSGGVKATGKPVQVRGFAVRRFEDGQVAEISTIQDQFALLKQMGYFPEESMRRSRARWPRAAGGGRWPASCGAGVQAQCRSRTSCRHVDSAVGWRQPWTVSRYQ